jgi:hypothetical protein
MEIPANPKPKDQPHEAVALRVYGDGREVCDHRTEEGRAIYKSRTQKALRRQGGICCLKPYIRECPGTLMAWEATLDHEEPRGAGGGNRDDRIEVPFTLPDGKVAMLRQNGAAHGLCNSLKGSRRIPYNDAYNAALKAHNGGPSREAGVAPSGVATPRISPCEDEAPAR